jgi:predicted nucleotidyltransferase
LRDVRLFGSYARGEAYEDSDIDVLVVVDALTEKELGAAAGDAAVVAMETGRPLAPLPIATDRLGELRSAERLLVTVLDEEGISL